MSNLCPAIVLGLQIVKTIPTSTGLGQGEKSPALGRAVFSFASIIWGLSRVYIGSVKSRADAFWFLPMMRPANPHLSIEM
jgi:hypothetical protein